MATQKKTNSSKKNLMIIGIALLFLIPIGLSYVTIKKNKEQKLQQENSILVADPNTAIETEKALQLLSTQVNKGLDSIKKNHDEK